MVDRNYPEIFGSLRAAIVAAGAAEFSQLKADPRSFLADLEVGMNLGDELLRSSLADDENYHRVWLGILTLADLREKGDPLWQECEPVILRFWERVNALGLPHDPALK